MESLRVYNELEITYQELETALLSLGYKKTVGDFFVSFYNKKFDSQIKYAKGHKLQDKMNKAHFLAASKHLELKGVIQDVHDFAKLIEQMRQEAAPCFIGQ